MPNNLWRGLLAICVIASAVLLVLQLPPSRHYPDLGFTPRAGGSASQIAIAAVEPNGAAASAGLHVGDTIELRTLSLADRIDLLYQRRAGDAIPLTVLRDGKPVAVSLAPLPNTSVPLAFWLGFGGMSLLVIFGALIGWRRPDSQPARLLALVLLTSVLATELAFLSFGSGGPILELTAWTLAALIGPLGPLLFARYVDSFGTPSRIRHGLYVAQFALAGIAAAFAILPVISVLTLRIAPGTAGFAAFLDPGLDLQYLLALISAGFAIGASRGDERQRILWATIATTPFILAGILLGLPGVPWWIGDIALFVWPIGLAYATLRGKILDAGFAFNRAAVFAVLSAIVLVLFVTFEWILAEFFKPFGHEADISLTLGFALVLGISMRYIHHKVDHVLDAVLFRKRNADLRALREYAREAPFITDRTVLYARTASLVSAHTGGADTRIVRDDGETVNDPAMVALRARREPVELAATGSAIVGELALPVFAGAKLCGALVCGTKPDGGSYAPDERAALAAVAAGVGQSLLAMRDGESSVLAEILAELRGIRSRLDTAT